MNLIMQFINIAIIAKKMMIFETQMALHCITESPLRILPESRDLFLGWLPN